MRLMPWLAAPLFLMLAACAYTEPTSVSGDVLAKSGHQGLRREGQSDRDCSHQEVKANRRSRPSLSSCTMKAVR